MTEDEYTLYHADCFDVFPSIPDHAVDMILCDMPYGRTNNAWDAPLPLDALWAAYTRIAKPNACIALFADGLFMAKLMLSQQKLWKYNLVWDKVLTNGFLNANRQPLRQHEEICIFYRQQPVYHPQKTVGAISHSKGKEKNTGNSNYNHYNFCDNTQAHGNMKHPTSILRFSKPHPATCVHPTEKPVLLLEHLIKTYTNEGALVLDHCMGSGSTGVACIKTQRQFMGIEKEESYFTLATQRISKESLKHETNPN